jgi:sugar lactone lactonase YvrE
MKNMKSTSAIFTLLTLSMAPTTESTAQAIYEPYAFSTLAGGASSGSADGVGLAARFNFPTGVAVDSSGNVYVADSGNNTIRKVTPAGVVTTLAGRAESDPNGASGDFPVGGSADGTAKDARFRYPSGVAVDNEGNIYVGDSGNDSIRKVTPAGIVTTLAGLAGSPGNADGLASAARFSNPAGIAVDSSGNLYVADSGNNTVRKVTPAGLVTTVAGRAGSHGSNDEKGSEARFYYPTAVTVDSGGNVYVADTGNYAIRKVTPEGMVTTLARLECGSCTVNLNALFGVAVDTTGNVYVAYTGSNTILKVTPPGLVSTLAGLASAYPDSADGTASAARFRGPQGLAADTAGNVYVADTGNNSIRKVAPEGMVMTLAGNPGYGIADGTGRAAQFRFPTGLAIDNAGDVYVGDSGNHTVRKVTSAGVVTTLAGLAGSAGSTDGTGSSARFYRPSGVAVDSAGSVYVADEWNCTIRKVTPTGVVTTLAGLAQLDAAGDPVGGSADGIGNAARFSFPSGVAVDGAGNVYVADRGNVTIRKVTPTGVVTTLAGSAGNSGLNDGTGSSAQFRDPSGLAVDSAGNIYVAGWLDFRIRKVTATGVVTTLAGVAGTYGSADGMGSAARFGGFPDVVAFGPFGVAVDAGGNLYVADTGNFTIRKVTPIGLVTTLAGLAGTYGSADGIGSDARFGASIWNFGPTGVAVDSAGNIYVADYSNNSIRKGSRPLVISASGSSFGFNGGQFGFDVTGPPGQSIVIESSIDLLEWSPVWSNSFAGTVHFRELQTAASSSRFFRARTP